MNAPITLQQGSALAAAPAGDVFNLAPRTLTEAMQFADLLAKSTMIPKDYQGQPGNILVAVQWGAEINLKPLQAMQNISVINGRPGLWGDAMLALVRADPRCEWFHEAVGTDGVAVVRTKRRGDPHEHTRTFSDADAKQAGLANKAGPWTQSPKRMKQLRARAFLIRDVYTDVIRGMPMVEELWDHPPEAAYSQHTSADAHKIPADLRQACDQAAAAGSKAYSAWWKTLQPQQRQLFLDEANYHDQAKQRALKADEGRKAQATDVNARPAAAPAPAAAHDDPAAAADESMTFERWQELLARATNPVALDIANDWIASLPEADQAKAHQLLEQQAAKVKQ